MTTTRAYPDPVRDRHVHDKHHTGVHHRDAQDFWVPLFRGAWLVVVGALAFMYPSVSMFALALFFATTAFVSGGAILTDTMWMSHKPRIYMTQGIISILIGAIVAFSPQEAAPFVVGAVSAWAIAMGALDLVVVNRHRTLRGRTMITAAGATLILAGLLGFLGLAVPRVLNPALFGALALLAGALLVGYGVRRRRRKGHVSARQSAHADDERRIFGAT